MASTTRRDADHAALIIDDPRRRRAILWAVCIALMTVVASVTGLNVAQPQLATTFDASQGEVLWIINTRSTSRSRESVRRLRARTVDHPAAVAPTLRTRLGALRPAPALALRLRRGAARLRSPRLAPGLRRGPRTPARLGRCLRLASRPRQGDTSDRLAWGRSGTVGRRDAHRGPVGRLPQVRRRRRRAQAGGRGRVHGGSRGLESSPMNPLG